MSESSGVLLEGLPVVALMSGLGAGGVAILATVAIERLGGHLGGIIGTLPTTIIPASWGLWRQGISAVEGGELDNLVATGRFEAAMYAVPAGMCLNAIFLWLWRVIPQHDYFSSSLLDVQREAEGGSRELWVAVVLMSFVTLSLWLAGALLLVTLSKVYLSSSELKFSAALIATLTIVFIGAWATTSGHEAPRGKRVVHRSTLLLRGLCAAIAVFFAVLISKSGSTTSAGVAAVFPAIFWTTMASLWLSQGRAVPAGAVGPMMIGSSSVALYALVAPALYMCLGASLGAFTAWIISAIGASLPSYMWVKRAQLSS